MIINGLSQKIILDSSFYKLKHKDSFDHNYKKRLL